MRNYILIIPLFAIAFFSCKRQKCLKSTGKASVITADLPNFQTLEIQEKLVPTIIIDTINYAVIRGGENVIPFVSFDNPEGQLVVYNRNKCDFLRSMKKKIEVEIHCKPFSKIVWKGSEPITVIGKVQTDELYIQLDDSVHDLEMDIETNSCIVAAPEGSAKFILHGATNNLFINAAANTSGNTTDLTVQNLIHVENFSPGKITLQASCDSLVSIIHASGDVLYYGEPVHISSINNGSGQLIDLD